LFRDDLATRIEFGLKRAKLVLLRCQLALMARIPNSRAPSRGCAKWLFLEEKATRCRAFGVQQLENRYNS
jgi:hypothetical protein